MSDSGKKAPFEKRPRMAWLLERAGYSGDECLLWPFACGSAGYGQFDAFKKHYKAHSYMCELVHGPRPEGYQAAHECGNPRCVNPRHLSWKTPADNQLDRRRHGRAASRWRPKLTVKQVIEVRALRGKELATDTAARLGVSEANIRQIQSGKIWRLVSTCGD